MTPVREQLGLHRRQGLQTEAGQGCFPRRQYGNGNRDDIPREHDGATHAGHSDPCRGGNGVDEKTLLCALTKVTVYKGCQPLAFGAGAAGEQFG